jgi:hypothetical protein
VFHSTRWTVVSIKVQLDSTIWDLLARANMALIWMTRKGSWVQVPHGPCRSGPVFEPIPNGFLGKYAIEARDCAAEILYSEVDRVGPHSPVKRGTPSG